MEETVHTLSLSAAISASNPLELVKSRFQTMNELVAKGSLKQKYQGILDCYKSVRKIEGFRGFWKGNSLGLLRFFPNEKINNEVKNYARSILPVSCWSNVAAGVFGGWVAAAMLYPIDTVRIFLATSSQNQTETLRDLAKNVKRHGVNFLYRGYQSSMLGIAIFRGSYFGLYDSFKGQASSIEGKWTIAYFSGLFAGLITYPIETIRKRKIILEKKIGQSVLLKQVIKTEGLKGLFRGCTLTPIQSLVGAAILLYFDKE